MDHGMAAAAAPAQPAPMPAPAPQAARNFGASSAGATGAFAGGAFAEPSPPSSVPTTPAEVAAAGPGKAAPRWSPGTVPMTGFDDLQRDGGAAAAAVQPKPQPRPAQQPRPLLAGWEAAADPASGQTYYYNSATGQSTWDRPAAPDRTLPLGASPERSTLARKAILWAPLQAVFSGTPTALRKRKRTDKPQGRAWEELLHARVTQKQQAMAAQGSAQPYYVERIVDSRAGGAELLVKWVGLPVEKNTWELRANLQQPGVIELVTQYDRLCAAASPAQAAALAASAPLPTTSAPAAPAAALVRSALAGEWTEAEFQELSAMIGREGAGNWQDKAARFSTNRSGRALQQFWCKSYGRLLPRVFSLLTRMGR